MEVIDSTEDGLIIDTIGSDWRSEGSDDNARNF